MFAKLAPMLVLVADDDDDDKMFIAQALAEQEFRFDLRFVQDGEELLDYLKQRGKFDPTSAPRPGLLLLDLNMPRKGGLEVLKEIKADAHLKHLPVIVMSTSKALEDIRESYAHGSCSFITKPVVFDDMVKLLRALDNYWFDIVKLPT